MFSNGQLLFGILFAVVFALVLFLAYKKDTKLHERYYKGSVWVLIFFVSFILLIAAIKFFLGK